MSHAAATTATVSTEPNGLRDSLSRQVQELINDAHTTKLPPHERRLRDRFPIPYTFRLTPIDGDGHILFDETTTVVGKDLSLTGIAFSHDHELTFERAIISLNHPKVGHFAVEAQIVWTKVTPIGLYESGCRLLRTVDGHIVRQKN